MRRGNVEGDNPFEGHRRRKMRGREWLPFSNNELKKIVANLPSQVWLRELIMVGLYTGMRLNEFCSLTWRDLKQVDGVSYFNITAAKSVAGVRPVPVHSELSWLLERREDDPEVHVWQELSPGPRDNNRGAYASRAFGHYKRDKLGIGQGERKVFHSFRKCATRAMRRAGVPEDRAAEIVGHEKQGITYSVYDPEGMTMQERKDVVETIAYPVDLSSLSRS